MERLSRSDLSFIKDKRVRWVLLVLLASLPLLGWWTYGLFDLDEGFYASVVGSMIRHREWITPLYNGEPWFEKPILLYWLAKPCVMWFGEAVGPRLPSVLATIGTYAGVAWFARRRFGALPGVLSLFILGGSLLPVAVGRMMMTDALLMLCFTGAMLTFWESLVASPRWRCGTAAFLGFAVLDKGPVSLILFVLIAGWTWWILPRGAEPGSPSRSSFRGYWGVGTLILASIIAAWYLPAYRANGQSFVDEFLIKQNLGRFTGGDQAHSLPLYKGFIFYVPILLAGMLPWSLFLPAAWPKKGSRSLDPKEALTRYLAAWAAVVFLFFTLSSAKLAHYVLPCCPPLAMLVGSYLGAKWNHLDRSQMRPKLALMAGWLLVVWGVAQFGFQYWYRASGQEDAHAMAKWTADHYPGSRVVLYRLSRLNKDLGTGKPEIQETSLPSLSFYLLRDVKSLPLESDADAEQSFQELLGQRPPIVVFTRLGRITDDQIRQAPDLSGGKQLLVRNTGAHYQVLMLLRMR